MFAWLLNLAYGAALVLLVPWLAWRRVVRGKRLGNLRHKLLGLVPRRMGDRPCLWFHAVSVGEVLLLPQIVEAISKKRGDFDLVISTTTPAGNEIARKRFPQASVVFFPLDLTWAVGRAIDRMRPTAVVLVELELWPNFLHALARRGVPVVLVNGRVSDKSYRGYLRLRWLTRRMLSPVSALAAQNACYAERFMKLGATPARVTVTRSVKFDGLETRRDNAKTSALRRLFGLAPFEIVLVAGSTHEPEEQIVLASYRQLAARFGRLRLVLVPRHPERFDAVAALVERKFGLPLLRRSRVAGDFGSAGQSDPPISPEHDTVVTPPKAVILLDTVGELAPCWGLADLAFVGGSLAARGGQNMIEPAAYGAAVLVGPNTWNFSDVVLGLVEDKAATVVRDGAELTAALALLLENADQRIHLGKNAQRHVLAHRGAAERTAELICRFLPTGQVRRDDAGMKAA